MNVAIHPYHNAISKGSDNFIMVCLIELHFQGNRTTIKFIENSCLAVEILFGLSV